MRGQLGAALLALVTTACTAIVAAELNKYDGYKVSDSLNPADDTDKCALTDPDASNSCSTCIAQNCAANVAFACPADGGAAKKWFEQMQSCAQNPVEGYDQGHYEQYGCHIYDNPDAQPLTTGDDNQKEREALLCVRDHCLYDAGAVPPCHQCVVSVGKTGSAGGYARLEDDPCGKCISDHCGALLVKCCDTSLPDGLATCAYTGDPDNKKTCHDAVFIDAGGPDAEPRPGGIDHCTWEFAQTCYPQCKQYCPAQ
jgi:hypothetical protein